MLAQLTRQVDEMARGLAGTGVLDAHILVPEPDALRLLANPARWAERPIGYLQIDAETAVKGLRGKWKPSGTISTQFPVVAGPFAPISADAARDGESLLDAARRMTRETALQQRLSLDDGEHASPLVMLFRDGDGAFHITSPEVVTAHGRAQLTVEQPAGVHRAVFHSLNDSNEYASNGLVSSSGALPAGSGSLHLATSASDAREARSALFSTLTGR